MEKNLFVTEEDDILDVQSGHNDSGEGSASEVVKQEIPDSEATAMGEGMQLDEKPEIESLQDQSLQDQNLQDQNLQDQNLQDQNLQDQSLHGHVEDQNLEDQNPQNTQNHPIDDDPIIKSIPLIHGCVPQRSSQSLHLLQFPGRNKIQNFSQSSLRTVMKPESRVVELKTPMDTAKFYDDNRTEELGTRVENVSLQGVMTEAVGGLYAGKAILEGDGTEKIILTPLDSSAQLRASFKYIDDLDTARVAQMKQDNVQPDASKQAAVHVLQTASKASSQINTEGPVVGGAGSCLRHIKKFNEEPWQALSWRSSGDSATTSLISSMQDVKSDHISATTKLGEII